MNPRPEVQVLNEGPVTAALSGDGGLGMIVAARAMHMAIARGRELGIVTTTYHDHVGSSGKYVRMALREDLIGISLSGRSAAPSYAHDSHIHGCWRSVFPQALGVSVFCWIWPAIRRGTSSASARCRRSSSRPSACRTWPIFCRGRWAARCCRSSIKGRPSSGGLINRGSTWLSTSRAVHAPGGLQGGYRPAHGGDEHHEASTGILPPSRAVERGRRSLSIRARASLSRLMPWLRWPGWPTISTCRFPGRIGPRDRAELASISLSRTDRWD